MLIRKADHEDVDKVAALYDALHSYLEKSVNYPGWKRGIYPTREDAVEGITEGTLWMAVCDGKVAGTMILNHEPENGYEQAKWSSECDYRKILVIHTLAVHPQFMKSGIGNQLLEYAREYAVQKNMEAVRLDVYEKNMPAIRLYESAGFQYVDTVDLGYSIYNLPLFRLYEKILEQPEKEESLRRKVIDNY